METLWTQYSSGWFRYRDFAGWRLSGHKIVMVGSVTGTLLDGDSLDARHEVVVGSVTGTLLDGDSLDTR